MYIYISLDLDCQLRSIKRLKRRVWRWSNLVKVIRFYWILYQLVFRYVIS